MPITATNLNTGEKLFYHEGYNKWLPYKPNNNYFETIFEGNEYRNLGDITTTSGEQIGNWQVENKNGKWITVKNIKRLRQLDNMKDEIEDAQRIGR